MNNYYQLYLQSVQRFAETVTMKFTDVASAVNQGVIAAGLSTTIEPTWPNGWKYYQNIAGLPHHTRTVVAGKTHIDWHEDPILVMSMLDPSKQVELTTCLDPQWIRGDAPIDAATVKAYAYGSRFYRELIQSYPDRVPQILGVVHRMADLLDDPTAVSDPYSLGFIARAVNAKDGTILHYQKDTIEAQEVTLMDDVQGWIYNYIFRWVNRAYTITDDLYCATYIAQLALNLIPCLLCLRLERCKTSEAHSFHVRSYLSSHNRMDEWLDILNEEQKGFFYRNINYLQRHAGKQDSFEWLIDNVMAKRGFPMYAYEMKLSESSQLDHKNNTIQQHLPEPVFTRLSLNEQPSNFDDGRYTFDQMQGLINPIAPLNEDLLYYHRDQVLDPLVLSGSAAVPTKVLQSVLRYFDEYSPYTRPWMALQHWGWIASQGKYNTTVAVDFPGQDSPVPLTAHQAYVLWLYFSLRGAGMVLEKIPNLYFEHVCRREVDWFKSISRNTDMKLLGEVTYRRIVNGFVPILTQGAVIQSVEDFTTTADKIHDYYKLLYSLYSRRETAAETTACQIACSQAWADYVISVPETGRDAASWVSGLGIDVSTYSASDFTSIANSLQFTFTGIDLSDSANIRRIQRGLIEIMKKLSSYSVMYISDAASQDIVVLEGTAPRISSAVAHSASESLTEPANIEVKLQGHARSRQEIPATDNNEFYYKYSRWKSVYWSDLDIRGLGGMLIRQGVRVFLPKPVTRERMEVPCTLSSGYLTGPQTSLTASQLNDLFKANLA